MAIAPRRTRSTVDTERISSLELIIDEQRRDYDYLLRIYDRAGAKENVLLTATFGVLAFLYYKTPINNKLGIAKRLFFPEQDYGKIIYIMAASFLVYGLIKLTLNVFGDNPWHSVYETPKNDYSYKYQETLEYVKKRHDDAHDHNLES